MLSSGSPDTEKGRGPHRELEGRTGHQRPGRSEPSAANGAHARVTSAEGEDDNDANHHYILEGAGSAATGPSLSLQHLQRPGETEHRLRWRSSSSDLQ